ncbi:uncharacterized protein LOC144129993 [Amblyomma americanum]
MKKPEQPQDDTSSAEETSGMSTLQVHTSRRLGTRLSQRTPSQTQVTQYEKPKTKVAEAETESRSPQTTVAPPREPENVEDSKPDPGKPTSKGVGKKLSSLSKVKRRSASRLRKAEAALIPKKPKKETPVSPLMKHRPGATQDSHRRSSSTRTIRKDAKADESSAPSDRARESGASPEQSNEGQSTEGAIDSLQRGLRSTTKCSLRSEAPLGYLFARTGDVTPRTAMNQSVAAGMFVPPSTCRTCCFISHTPYKKCRVEWTTTYYQGI